MGTQPAPDQAVFAAETRSSSLHTRLPQARRPPARKAHAEVSSIAPTPGSRSAEVRAVVDVCGVAFDTLSVDDVVTLVVGQASGGVGGSVVTPNLHILRSCHRDAELHQLVSRFSLCLPDGAPVVWAARLAGTKGMRRVAGSDVAPALIDACAGRDLRIFFLGGGEGVAAQAAEAASRRWPDAPPAGAFGPSRSAEFPAEEVTRMRDAVRSSGAQVVFVGLGFPKQELLIEQLLPQLPTVWFLGVGAALDFTAGTARRAPAMVRQLDLEWAHRLILEPRRLYRRYLFEGVPFLVVLILGALRRRWSAL